MKPQEMINRSVSAGKDVVFAENHAVIEETFAFMEQAILDNPSGVGGVSLELPVEIQESLNKAAELSEDAFIKQVRIEIEMSSQTEALKLLDQGRISQDQYDGYIEIQNTRISDVINGTHVEYSEEKEISDQKILGQLHALAKTGAENGVPVLANDLDRGYRVLVDMGGAGEEITISTDEYEQRYDDTTDFELLSSQVDIENAKPILVHRGANHARDINGHATGLDDTLERAGRNVVTIAHTDSFDRLQYSMDSTLLPEKDTSFLGAISRLFNDHSGVYGDGWTINDPSDYSIIGDEAYEQSDLSLYEAHKDTFSP